MATPTKPPITAHVLNTVSGLPAANIPVTLTLIRPYGPSSPLTATTNADGRILSWDDPPSGPTLQELFDNARNHILSSSKSTVGDEVKEAGSEEGTDGVMVWALHFNVGAYFKGEGFWDVVEIRFKTDVREGLDSAKEGQEAAGRSHWHVPLLLSPWSYTTYRGS